MSARVFREVALATARASRAPLQPRHLIGSIALASAMVLLSFGAAQAQTATTTQLISAPNPSAAGEPVTFTATVVPATPGAQLPSGTVTFLDGGTPIGTGTLTPNGDNSFAVFLSGTLSVGTHTITSSYPGDANFGGSNGGPLSQIVNKNDTKTLIIASPNPSTTGQSASIDVVVSPVTSTIPTVFPTGTVNVFDNGNQIATLTLNSLGENSSASFVTSFTSTGNHNITMSYAGDANFNGNSNGTLTQVVNPTVAVNTSVTVSASPTSSMFGQSVTFTATITPASGTTAPGGTVTFSDGITTLGTANVSAIGATNMSSASITTTGLPVGSLTITASYSGNATFNPNSGSTPFTVGKNATTTRLTSTPDPSTPGQAVTFTATVRPGSGASGMPTGTVMFTDNSTNTTLGTVMLINGVASISVSTLAPGSHSIIATYSGDGAFAGGMSNTLVQNVTNNNSDSVKLRELQVSATPIIANAWAQSVTAAMDDAVTTGFSGNPRSLSTAGTGFTYYFDGDQPAQRSAESDQDALKRYLGSPDGNPKRVDDDFGALGYAPMATKAPPASASAAPHDWLAWINVRGTDFYRGTFGDDLKGEQVDAIAGLTRRLTSNFVVGVLGGYEHFDYSSQAFNGVLKGDGWTAGAFLGWKLSPNVRFDAGTAWSDLLANDTSGTASGNFLGTRWLVSGGLTGTYPWQMLVLEPSARVFALWERENAYTDSLGTLQATRNFDTGRASTGIKVAYPFAWSSTVALSPYAGLYADYYFSQDDAQTVGLTTVPLLQGFSARMTGGIEATFAGGASLGAGGEFGGIGSDNHIWTWTARGRIPF